MPKYQISIKPALGAENDNGPMPPTRGNAGPVTCPKEDLNLHALYGH